MFNESFATTVELEGVHRWLDYTKQPELFAGFERSRKRYGEFLALVMDTRAQLEEIYRSDASEDTKRVRKAHAFDRMRASYQDLKASWGGYSGYDGWFAESLNNAKLGSIAAYNQLVPAFQALLSHKKGDLGAFYAAVRELADLPEEQRRARLSGL
jgi:predicted aminopeptidase